MLVALAAAWGAAFLFIAIAVGDLGPIGLSVTRIVTAALGLMVWAKATGRRFWGKRSRRDYILLGTINAAIPFALVAAAELTIPASLAAIVNATAPLFSALVAAVWLGDRLDARRSAGLALGLAGVALVVGLAPVHGGVSTVLAVAAVLGAAASFGIGGHLVKMRFSGEGPLTLAICQPLGATVVSVPFLAAIPPRHVPGWGTIAAILVLGVGCTGFAYLLYFRLIDELGATSALTVTYLVPVFGVLWATLFRDEHITPGMLAGAAVVLAGVLLVTGTGSRAAAPVP
jgi:drug/metabolite transporter (DMT)-like permease